LSLPSLPDKPSPPFSRGGDIYGYVWWLVSSVPKGKVTTYGDVARALGDLIAARAVGVALSRNPYVPKVPCHRVIMSDGHVGGYALGVQKKIEMLKEEGVPIVDEMVKVEDAFWRSFPGGPGPLDTVAKEQVEFAKRLRRKDKTFSCEIGVDASYSGPDAGYEIGVGAAVMKCKGEIRQAISREVVTSPYIPTYFHLREAPLIYSALNNMAREFGKDVLSLFEDIDAVLLVDGDGIMHPRHFGLASSVGYNLGIPSIGVAKSLLTGKIRDGEVVDEKSGELLGSVLEDKGKLYYISPGNGLSVGSATEQVKRSYPEVLKRAHHLCTVEGHVNS
jgi:deoxyribonuclease V